MGGLVPPADTEEQRLRKVHESALSNEHRPGLLEGVCASQAALVTAYRLRLPRLQGGHPARVGGRGEQARRQVDHAP